jgi:hypothetical protein
LNIKELDRLLQSWGCFWAGKEALQGYANTSVTERCCEVMRTGIWVSSDKHLFSHHAASIFVPEWVGQIDKVVEQLAVPERQIINRFYIKKAKLLKTEWPKLWQAQAAVLSLY